MQHQFRPVSTTRILPLSLPSDLADLAKLSGGPNVLEGWEGTIRIAGDGSVTSQRGYYPRGRPYPDVTQ